MSEKKQPDLTQKVMKQIKTKKIKMKPKIYFLLGSLVLGIGLVAAFCLAGFFTHVVFFRLRVHEPFGFLRFGLLGFGPFFHALPLIPLLIAIGGIWGGLKLLKKYDFSYKKSFLALSLAVIIATLIIGFGLDRAGLPQRMAKIPPLHPWFQPDPNSQDWLVGEVLASSADSLVIKTPEEKEVTVTITEKTHFPMGTEFSAGEKVMAVGEWQEDQFVALGIARHQKPTPDFGNGPKMNGQFHPKGMRQFRQMLP